MVKSKGIQLRLQAKGREICRLLAVIYRSRLTMGNMPVITAVFVIIFALISIETLCAYWELKHSNFLQQLGDWSSSTSLQHLHLARSMNADIDKVEQSVQITVNDVGQ
jgi:hypothetical protein